MRLFLVSILLAKLTVVASAAAASEEELVYHHSPHAPPVQAETQSRKSDIRGLQNTNTNRRLHNGEKHREHHLDKKRKKAIQSGRQFLSTDQLAALQNALGGINDKSIFGIASNQTNFSTLATAIEKAGLRETLTSKGSNYTVFAPVNLAFEKIDDQVLSKLLRPIWQPQLQDLLLYHTVDRSDGSEEIEEDGTTTYTTLNGEDITTKLSPARVNGDSLILVEDIEASNGIINGIDTVLSPTSLTMDVVEKAEANDDLSTLVAALTAAGLGEALSGDGPFTVFAPTNEAFAALPEGTLKSLLLPENKDRLTKILKHHVVAANAASTNGAYLQTLNGDSIAIHTSLDDGTIVVTDVPEPGVAINGANVVKADIIASNGIIHMIDRLLVPPDDDDGVVDNTEDSQDIGNADNVDDSEENGIAENIDEAGSTENTDNVDEAGDHIDAEDNNDTHQGKASKTGVPKSKSSKKFPKSAKVKHGKVQKNPAAKMHKIPDVKLSSKQYKGPGLYMPIHHHLKSKSFKGKVHKNLKAKMHKNIAAKMHKKEHDNNFLKESSKTAKGEVKATKSSKTADAKAHKIPIYDAKAKKISSNGMKVKGKQSKVLVKQHANTHAIVSP